MAVHDKHPGSCHRHHAHPATHQFPSAGCIHLRRPQGTLPVHQRHLATRHCDRHERPQAFGGQLLERLLISVTLLSRLLAQLTALLSRLLLLLLLLLLVFVVRQGSRCRQAAMEDLPIDHNGCLQVHEGVILPQLPLHKQGLIAARRAARACPFVWLLLLHGASWSHAAIV